MMSPFSATLSVTLLLLLQLSLAAASKDTSSVTQRKDSKASGLCSTDNDCQEPEKCVDANSGSKCSSENCVCLSSVVCEQTSDCNGGLVCIDFPGETNVCFDKGLAEAAGLEEVSSVCIDARALSAFRPDELVFEKHAVATVLCDSNESCATPGHMVHWNGSGMMMRTYCDIVGCVQKRMEVNSPSYKRGIRVPSNTEGLHFTAFAARYETSIEETAIRAVIRIGL